MQRNSLCAAVSHNCDEIPEKTREKGLILVCGFRWFHALALLLLSLCRGRNIA